MELDHCSFNLFFMLFSSWPIIITWGCAQGKEQSSGIGRGREMKMTQRGHKDRTSTRGGIIIDRRQGFVDITKIGSSLLTQLTTFMAIISNTPYNHFRGSL